MNILICPDGFKESLTALQVAHSIESGLRTVWPDAAYRLLPIADGGEGTAQAMADAMDGEIRECRVTGPLETLVTARYTLIRSQQTAVIEMAAASGLELVPPAQRNPDVTTTRGTGELILDALEQGAKRIIVGLGGSATNDGGAGMLQALGADLLGADGHPIAAGARGLQQLDTVALTRLDSRLQSVTIQAACDVTNPLCGPQGASVIFGPQKGASLEQIEQMDRRLQHWGQLLEQTTGRPVLNAPGAGAAGGLGAALLAGLNATLLPGIELIARAVRLPEALQTADLVFTGEGRLDGQSVQGKAPVGVARLAAAAGVPVIGLGGSLGTGHESLNEHGLNAVFGAVQRPMPLETALSEAEQNLSALARQVALTIAVGMNLHK